MMSQIDVVKESIQNEQLLRESYTIGERDHISDRSNKEI